MIYRNIGIKENETVWLFLLVLQIFAPCPPYQPAISLPSWPLETRWKFFNHSPLYPELRVSRDERFHFFLSRYSKRAMGCVERMEKEGSHSRFLASETFQPTVPIHPLRSIGHKRANSFFSRLKSLAPRRRESFSFRQKIKGEGGKFAEELMRSLLYSYSYTRTVVEKKPAWISESSVKQKRSLRMKSGKWSETATLWVRSKEENPLSLKVLNSTVQQLCPWLRSSYDQLFFRFQSYVVQQKMILSLLIWRSSLYCTFTQRIEACLLSPPAMHRAMRGIKAIADLHLAFNCVNYSKIG